MRIGIIGYGVVGKAIDKTLKKKYRIVKYDKYLSYDEFEDLSTCDFVFISVPTPYDCKAKKVIQSAVIDSLSRLQKLRYNKIVIIKSTILPGSSAKYSDKYDLNIAFNPEFLRESTTPNEDFENQEIIVIGTNNLETFKSIKKMYQAVAVPHAKYYHTTSTEAEMIKYSQNTMLASRVALANMIYDACQEINVDYNKLREIAFDSFEILGPHMAQVPGPDGNRGFGGKCLPKDIRGFATLHDSPILNKIIEYNDYLRDDLDKFLINLESSRKPSQKKETTLGTR